MRFLFFFFLFILFIGAGFFICLNYVRAEVISTNTIWSADEIHILPDGEILEVEPDVKLTLEAGTILKLGWNSAIRLHGSSSLITLGTVDNPVVITSLRDDSVGGDSNGDGPMTTPQPGDWRVISSYSAKSWGPVTIDFDHTILSYGGGTYAAGSPLMLNQDSSLRITNSQLINNKGAIILLSLVKNAAINNSDIWNPDFCVPQEDNPNYCGMWDGIKNYTSKSFDFSGNYWGDVNGPSIAFPEVNYRNGTPLAEVRGGKSVYEPYKTKPIWRQQKLDPVILIPGILGSWYRPTTGKWEIDPILNTYHDLWQALEAAGYEEGKTLFAFPYQWRQSNVLTALELKEKIAEIKTLTGSQKVDLVTHSMGGLVARQYIETPGYAHDVDQLIFIATPHHGAPKAYLMWEGAEFGAERKDKLMKYIFSLEAVEHGYDDRDGLVKYFRDFNINSVKELLPDYDYLRLKDSQELLNYPNGYPTNQFLEIINNPAFLNNLSEVKILNIVADSGNNETLSVIRIGSSTQTVMYPDLWEHGEPDGFYDWFSDHGLENGAGDDTVPLVSNNAFNGSHQESFFGATHQSIVSKAQKVIIKELTNSEPEVEFFSSPIEKLLMFRIFSPADFQVIAPNGQRLGRNFSGDGIIEEIPAGYYSGFASSAIEYAIIPNPLPGEYKIELLGIGEGNYRLVANYIDDSTSTEAVYSGTITTNDKQELKLSYQNETVELSKVETTNNINSSGGGGTIIENRFGSGGAPISSSTVNLLTKTDYDFNLIKQEIIDLQIRIKWLEDYTLSVELYNGIKTDDKIFLLDPLVAELNRLRDLLQEKKIIIQME